MANNLQTKVISVRDLNSQEVDSLLKVIEILFKEELDGKEPRDVSIRWSLPFIELGSDKITNNEFKRLILESVESNDIRSAHGKLQELYEQKVSNRTQVVEDQPGKTSLNKEESEDLVASLDKTNKTNEEIRVKTKSGVNDFIEKAKRAKVVNDAKQTLRERIANQEKQIDEIKGKVVYATVTIPTQQILEDEVGKVVSVFEPVKKDKVARLLAIEELSQVVQERIPELFTEMEDGEKKLNSRFYAASIVDSLTNPTPEINSQQAVQLAILDTIINNPDQLGSLVSPEGLKTITESSRMIFNQSANQEVVREIVKVLYGESVAEKMFGASAQEIAVSISQNPSDGAIPVELEKLVNEASRISQSQLQAVEAAQQSGTIAIGDFSYGGVSRIEQEKGGEEKQQKKHGDISPVIKDILSRSKPYGSLRFNSKTLEFATRHIQGSDQLLYLFQSVTGISLGISLASKVVPLTFGSVPTTIRSIQAIKWAGAPFTYGTAIGKQVSVQIGGKIAGQAAGQIASQAATQVATQVATQTGLRVTFAALFAQLGNVLPVIGHILFAVIGSWIAKHIDLAKIKKWLNENGPVLLGLFTGGLAMLGFGPLVGVGAGVLTFALTGGSIATLGAGVVGFFGSIGNIILVAIGTPLIIFFLSIPPIVAFIMLIINSGAYIVPPSPLSSALSQDNPYMSVTKKAEPNKIANPSGKSMVTYTVTITATKGILSNVKVVSSECKVTKENGASLSCPPENIPAIPNDLKINPGSPYSFTFNSEYDSKYSDSLIFDSIEISADAQEESGVTTSGSATVCIGDCPNSCVKVEDSSWGSFPSGKSNLTNAATLLVSEFPGFMDKVCAEGKPINVCYTTSDPTPIGSGGLCDGSYYARHIHTDKCDINFNQCGIKTEADASFLLTHELTHHIQNISGGGGYLVEYENNAFNEVESKGGFCSYPETRGSSEESQAESLGLFVSIPPSWGTCVTNYQSMYPLNYKYAQGFMTR